MITVTPESTFTAVTPRQFDTGLTGTIGVRIERPDGTTFTARTTVGIVEIEPGSGAYAKSNLVAPDTAGSYVILWDDGSGEFASEELRVTYSTVAGPPPGSGLLTLEEVKVALGYQDTNEKDALIEQTIPQVDAAIAAYTNRTFLVADPAAPAVERRFEYSESGIIELDDFKHGSITAVKVDALALRSEEFLVGPPSYEYPVGWWIELTPPRRSSPAMGFTRNEDVIALERGWTIPIGDVYVTAEWGWPARPWDVFRAAIWTIAAFMDRPQAYTSESIAGFSRTAANPLRDAIPPRAARLLDFHIKGGGD